MMGRQKVMDLYDLALQFSFAINFTVAVIIKCGSVVNNTLTSPGYPNNYPQNMDCNYSVPIPHNMAMRINLREFVVEYDLLCK